MLIKNYSTSDLLNVLLKTYSDYSPTSNDVSVPKYDIIENDKEFIIEMLLSGIKKEDIDINLEKNELKITAERKSDDTLNYNRKQIYTGKYEKSFILPDILNKENIDASLVDGILKITLSKLVEDIKLKNVKIEVK